MKILLVTATTLALLLGAGCREGDENIDRGAAKPDDSALRLGNPPTAWKTGPPTSTRKASYLVQDEGGAVADISLVVLPGSTGDLRGTVNQWRKQLGAPPLDRAAFEQHAKPLSTPSGDAVVIDIIGMINGANTAFDGRMVAAVIRRPNQTWIFKMRGNAALVGVQKEAFLDWMARVQPDAVEPSPSPPAEPPPLPAPALQPSPGREPTWQLPEDWTAVPPTPPHFATFSVPGPEGETGMVSVILLAGDGGGSLANVNRWRIEIGLSPITQQELAATTQSLWSADTEMTMIDLAGPERRTIAAWTLRKDGTWIVQFTAPNSVLTARRPAFARFLKSVRFAVD